MWLKAAAILAGVVSILTILGFGYKYLDTTYAKEVKMKEVCTENLEQQVAIVKVELRLDQKIVQDRYYDYQKRQWELEKQYGSFERMPEVTKDEYKRNQQEIERLKDELGIIQSKM